MAIVDTEMISPETLRELRNAAGHKQESLASALQCSVNTIRNFEQGKTRRLYCVRWDELARELKIYS
jgi:transcriptional regulator with XRE-family HTH domain